MNDGLNTSELVVSGPPTAYAITQAPPTPSALLALAVQQGADLAKLEKLMDLQERWEANEARKAFVAAMAAFKAEPIDIRKTKAVGYETREGDFVGYKHATTADVVDGVVAKMAKHGLSHAWDVKQDSGTITVTCTITHEHGHSESVSMMGAPDNSGKKNAIQQVASTVTYLQRYTLMSATGVAARDMHEDDGHDFDEEGEDEPEQDNKGRAQRGGSQSPEAIAARKAKHDEAYGRNSESVIFIKDRIAANDLAAAAAEWRALSEDDQRALWLAPTKGGCFTTAERATLHDKLPPREVTTA